MNTNYGIDDSNGNQITRGLPAHIARKTAQRIADERGETVFLFPERRCREDEDPAEHTEATMPEQIDPAPACECGEITGTPCPQRGAEVLIEHMPECHRENHRNARNRGVWPMNGAIRVKMHPDCAEQILSEDPDWNEVKS